MMAVHLAPAHTFAIRMRRAVKIRLSSVSNSELARAMNVSAARVTQMLKDDNWTIATIERILMAIDTIEASR